MYNKEIFVERKELNSLVVKKRKKDTKVFGIRVERRLLAKLKAKGIDVASTVRGVLERLAD